ncbi:hypothetical protein Ferp_1204 [Ferroglobus placidus DSM 10642]|uniref:Uncharacterized protein n=1 Tax=Ferroglobus placidus (strain DSM 10642 / AEDII12DO) TaxID=589924 RepID=D3RXZ9_FERPA|nr:hypothetical protein Ferp_1204 [Ferroglobus placidus DSM 10642]
MNSTQIFGRIENNVSISSYKQNSLKFLVVAIQLIKIDLNKWIPVLSKHCLNFSNDFVGFIELETLE